MRLLRRWGQLSLLARFTITGLSLTVLIAIVLGWVLAGALERSALAQEAEGAAADASSVLDQVLQPADLAAPLAPARVAELDRVARDRLLRAHTVRVKIWAPDGTIRYSSDPAEVGQHFDLADNDELREALGGELATEINEPDKAENQAEQGFGRLMEVYVPIRLGGDQAVRGAYEVYHDLAVVEPQIAMVQRLSWASIAVAFALLYLGLFGLVRAASIRERRQNEELGRLSARREMDRLTSDFVGVVSHELRTPLTGLVGFAELLLTRGEAAEEDRRAWMRRIHAEAERLSHLVEQLLDVVRIEEGRIPIETRELPLPEVVDDVLTGVRVSSPEHAFRVDVPDDLPPVVADRDRLAQVLLNLLSNAVKYSPGGGTITVGAQARDGVVRIGVADEGLGIPPDELPRLFGRFHRIHDERRQGIRGSGLGLHITRQLVELHGGRIWAESPGPGRGTTFYVELPAARPAAVRA